MENSADFIWSAKEWYMTEDSAWFIDAERSVLCCLNLYTEKCDGVVKIPNTDANSFMFNTDCVKVKNEIFCMPCYGDRGWVYDLINETFQFIEIKNQSKDTLFMDFCYIYFC